MEIPPLTARRASLAYETARANAALSSRASRSRTSPALVTLSLASLLLTLVVGGCTRGEGGGAGELAALDSLPVYIGDSLPFLYPPGPYIERIQDDVTLRLYLDEFGRPVPESTRVQEHAKHAAFDSSALLGAKDLVFRPAIRNGKAVPYPVLFPIKFRVPDGPPMPGDSVADSSKR